MHGWQGIAQVPYIIRQGRFGNLTQGRGISVWAISVLLMQAACRTRFRDVPELLGGVRIQMVRVVHQRISCMGFDGRLRRGRWLVRVVIFRVKFVTKEPALKQQNDHHANENG